MNDFEQLPDENQNTPVDDENIRPGLRLRRLLSRETLPLPASKGSEASQTSENPQISGQSPDNTDANAVPVFQQNEPISAKKTADSSKNEPAAGENTVPAQPETPDEGMSGTASTVTPRPEPANEPAAEDKRYFEVMTGDGLEDDTSADLATSVMPVNPDETVPLQGEPQWMGQEDATLPPASTFSQEELPRRVDELDINATQVTPAAWQSRPAEAERAFPARQKPAAAQYRAAPQQPARTPQRTAPPKKAAAHKPPKQKKDLGCLVRSVIVMAFVLVGLLVVAASYLVIQYFTILASLPEFDDLKNRASQFETTRILDREGNELYQVLDPNAGRRTYIPLDQMSPYVIAATIATEDKEFYNHPGYDPVALMRALWQNYTNQEIVSGASTITQQLARTLLFTADERTERSYQRKAREIILAAEITRKYSKDEILELYLNENNYGYLAYGIEAAAETYFHTDAVSLNLAQASFLAGIPQAPAVYDIFTNRDETLGRHEDVVVLIYELSKEENCIDVSNSVQPVCVDAAAAAEALTEIQEYAFELDQNIMAHPHWVNYVRRLLEEQYGAETIYQSGFTVYTTLDPQLQTMAEEILQNQVGSLADYHVTGGALVAIQPGTGEILAMVGSPDFYNETSSGQINMAISPRQPGSAIKPLTYTAAFEKGWTASTLIWDVPTDFTPSGLEDDNGPLYQPVNYDGRYHGPVTVRSALANSYNIPAVKALQYVGIYDNPDTLEEDGLINFAERMGITTFTQDDYGLALTLGGGEVTLLQLTNAFSVYANQGRYLEPVSILKIVDHEGKVVFEYEPEEGEQVIRREHAYIISSILSDNAARTPAFGSDSVLNLPFPAAVKTGTTNDFRDNWTIGYTPDLTVGVWIGNPDYTPMQGTTGVSGAAPIWAEYMQRAAAELTGGNYSSFRRPDGVTDEVVCTFSGTRPSEWCPEQYTEIFASDQLPLKDEEDLWVEAEIDTWTGLKASAECGDFTAEEMVLNVEESWARRWIRDTEEGREWASSLGFDDPVTFMPRRECRIDDPRPRILFAGLEDGQTITANPFDIYALITASDQFRQYRLDYGLGDDPDEWINLTRRVTEQHDPPDRIYTWDVTDVEPGVITLRIYVHSTEEGRYAEKTIHLNLRVPTRTPTLTPTSTATPTQTPEPTITATPEPTATAVPPTNTLPPPPPSDTPVSPSPEPTAEGG